MKVILMKTIKPDKYNTCLPTYYTVLLTLISSSPILFPSLKVKSKWCLFYFYFQRENSYLFIKNAYLYHARTWAQLCSWDFFLPIICICNQNAWLTSQYYFLPCFTKIWPSIDMTICLFHYSDPAVRPSFISSTRNLPWECCCLVCSTWCCIAARFLFNCLSSKQNKVGILWFSYIRLLIMVRGHVILSQQWVNRKT